MENFIDNLRTVLNRTGITKKTVGNVAEESINLIDRGNRNNNSNTISRYYNDLKEKYAKGGRPLVDALNYSYQINPNMDLYGDADDNRIQQSIEGQGPNIVNKYGYIPIMYSETGDDKDAKYAYLVVDSIGLDDYVRGMETQDGRSYTSKGTENFIKNLKEKNGTLTFLNLDSNLQKQISSGDGFYRLKPAYTKSGPAPNTTLPQNKETMATLLYGTYGNGLSGRAEPEWSEEWSSRDTNLRGNNLLDYYMELWRAIGNQEKQEKKRG